MTRFDSAQVREYYDRHTPAFVRFGQGGREGAIHRAVWGPGTTTRAEAFHYVDDQIVRLTRGLLRGRGSAHVVDLGCGVGASLCHLAERLPVRGTGITLSPLQATLASRRVQAAGLSERIVCLEGDYCAPPAGVGQADLAYAIESFVHGLSPARFFGACASLVRPGGLLAICDDFTRPAAIGATGAAKDQPPRAPRPRRRFRDRTAALTIERFARGWQVNTLIDNNVLRTLAADAGFAHESTTDLTPYLETRRPRDRAIDALATVVGRLPVYRTRLAPMLGGSALQTCLARGWIGYELVVFRREPRVARLRSSASIRPASDREDRFDVETVSSDLE